MLVQVYVYFFTTLPARSCDSSCTKVSATSSTMITHTSKLGHIQCQSSTGGWEVCCEWSRGM